MSKSTTLECLHETFHDHLAVLLKGITDVSQKLAPLQIHVKGLENLLLASLTQPDGEVLLRGVSRIAHDLEIIGGKLDGIHNTATACAEYKTIPHDSFDAPLQSSVSSTMYLGHHSPDITEAPSRGSDHKAEKWLYMCDLDRVERTTGASKTM